MIQCVDASIQDIHTIQDLAERIWWPTYSPILEEHQIRYMLDTIYSLPALTEVIMDGSQKFILLLNENIPEGFAAFGPRREDYSIYKLHKIYVLPHNHGRGFGKLLIEEVKKRIRTEGATALDLNVNRTNPARLFYEKVGFQIIREEDVPIGTFWMNDYVMRLLL